MLLKCRMYGALVVNQELFCIRAQTIYASEYKHGVKTPGVLRHEVLVFLGIGTNLEIIFTNDLIKSKSFSFSTCRHTLVF